MDSCCPLCGSPGTFLGLLGSLLWYRCHDCGADFSFDTPQEDDDDGFAMDL